MATILVVDDARIMRMNLGKMLSSLGHEVIGEAENGSDAIEKYKSLKPDVVTMDITMPEQNGIKDGIDATQHIKEFDTNAKIIMVTSHGEEEKVMKAIKAGAKNYILKPITIEKVKETLEKIL